MAHQNAAETPTQAGTREILGRPWIVYAPLPCARTNMFPGLARGMVKSSWGCCRWMPLTYAARVSGGIVLTRRAGLWWQRQPDPAEAAAWQARVDTEAGGRPTQRADWQGDLQHFGERRHGSGGPHRAGGRVGRRGPAHLFALRQGPGTPPPARQPGRRGRCPLRAAQRRGRALQLRRSGDLCAGGAQHDHAGGLPLISGAKSTASPDAPANADGLPRFCAIFLRGTPLPQEPA